MLKLAYANSDIAKAQRLILQRKSFVTEHWFRRRQEALTNHKKIIEQFTGIGKSLGDAFAWFFYQNEKTLLAEHIKHQSQKYLPIGKGGTGELQFIKGVKSIDGKLILYHGTTNLLRIGDFSLIDLKTLKVAAIGELKTGKQEGDKIPIKAIIVGDIESLNSLPIQENDQSLTEFDKPSPEAQARLERQINIMSKSLAAKYVKTDGTTYQPKESSYVDQLAATLNNTCPGRFTCRHAGGGLVFVVFRRRKSSLYNKISKNFKLTPESFTDDFVPLAVKTCCASIYNSLIIGSLQYSKNDSLPSLLSGTIPLFWWDIDLSLIKQIFFQETLALTIFNPAPLLEKLKADGLTVKHFNPPNDFTIELVENDKQYTLVHFEYFVNLIRFALFTENHIKDLVVDLINSMKAKQLQPNTQVEIRFDQVLSMPKNDSHSS